VIVPVATAELLAADEDELLALEAGLEAELEELLLEQPATAIADSAAMTTAKRRILTPWLDLRGPRSAGLGALDGDAGGLNGGNREYSLLQAELVRGLPAEP
jgi:hypothetical protein